MNPYLDDIKPMDIIGACRHRPTANVDEREMKEYRNLAGVLRLSRSGNYDTSIFNCIKM